MKKWWCKRCYLPCNECRAEYEDLLDSDSDVNGKLKVKTVDLRKQPRQSEQEFEEELAKADLPDFVDD